MIRKPIPARQDGVILLEALVATVIFTFGVLALIWMQAAATRQVTDAKNRLDASFAVNQVLGQMWTQRTNLGSFAKGEETLTSLPNGKRTVAVNGRQVSVTISWQNPGESKRHQYQAVALIN